MSELLAFVDGLVHEETQTGGLGLDLTVEAVHRVTAPGDVDFGGGELSSAGSEPVEPAQRHPADDYGWWELDAGTYLLAYNESLSSEDETFVLQPREALVERGASHPTLHVRTLPRVPLHVGEAGLNVKENARVSTLVSG